MIASIFLLFALTRAEIVERMRAPVVTQADGLVKVFASCSEAWRREYQMPVARFAADTIQNLYAAVSRKPQRFSLPGIVIFIGESPTNIVTVLTQVETNGTRVVSRLRIPNPRTVDLDYLRGEIAAAFFRSVEGRELPRIEALAMARRADPKLRVADARARLELWLEGRGVDDEEGFALLRKIIEPGVASRRDVITFASRLRLYPRTFDEKFVGGFDVLSFSEAVKFAKIDPRVRFLAFLKAKELPVWGGGRGEALQAAALAYQSFLLALAEGELEEKDLVSLLEAADGKLETAMEKAK